MLWEATIRHGGDLGKVDWHGAMRSTGIGKLELPARSEPCCRARVRLLTERAFNFPMEPLVVVPLPKDGSDKFHWRRELPSQYGFLVTAWLVSPWRSRDESRAAVWEAMDAGTDIRVSSVKDGVDGYCLVEVGVIARCEEHAETMVRTLVKQACTNHRLVFTPLNREYGMWIERRAQLSVGGPGPVVDLARKLMRKMQGDVDNSAPL